MLGSKGLSLMQVQENRLQMQWSGLGTLPVKTLMKWDPSNTPLQHVNILYILF